MCNRHPGCEEEEAEQAAGDGRRGEVRQRVHGEQQAAVRGSSRHSRGWQTAIGLHGLYRLFFSIPKNFSVLVHPLPLHSTPHSLFTRRRNVRTTPSRKPTASSLSWGQRKDTRQTSIQSHEGQIYFDKNVLCDAKKREKSANPKPTPKPTQVRTLPAGT
jgi:hypothetical protein